MQFHDPRREVEKLREHLAAHDKPIAFLLGAGTSCSVRDAAGLPLIPTVRELGVRCQTAVEALGDGHRDAYLAIRNELALSRPDPTIEDILSAVRHKVTAMTSGDQLAGTDRSHLEGIERAIREAIAIAVTPDPSAVPTTLPHHALARWISRVSRTNPVEIFTTNYDTLLEQALEQELVPVFDGFVGSRQPFFAPGSLLHENSAPGSDWCRLWKIHGSVNWHWSTSTSGERRIVRTHESTDGELILPSYEKYEQSRKQPYVAMLDRLARFLTVREDAVLICLGYSFGDQHINEILFDALGVRDRVHVFAVQYADPAADSDLYCKALRRPNLVVYSPSQAIVGASQGAWRLVEPVDNRLAGLLDIPFDSDGVPEADKLSLTGRFRLGDFTWFTRFLEQLEVADG